MKKIFLALLLLCLAAPAFAADAPKESVYDRVMRTGTIRCGYFLYPPALMKDPNTGAMSGIYYDYLEQLGHNLHLKIDWAEEIGLGDYPTALQNGRIDAMCSSIWINGARARAHDFVSPLFYLPLYLYTRTGDTRFDKDPMLLNDPKYKLAILEGGATDIIRREMFPKSGDYTLPQTTSPAELFLSLGASKADAVIYEPLTFSFFDKANPGKIRQASAKPVKVFASAIPVKHGEEAFRRMLSLATQEMQLSGSAEKILKKYETQKGAIYRVSTPYQEP